MFTCINRYLIYFFFLSLFVPITATAKQNAYSNQVQLQSLNSLNDIMDDATGVNLRRSSQSLQLTLSRLYTAIQLMQSLGNKQTLPNASNLNRPYAFIQSPRDRLKIIKNMRELVALHQQYKKARKNKKQRRKIGRSIFKRNSKIKHHLFKWRTRIGKARSIQKNVSGLRICRNLLPHEKHYSQWESCCDIGNNKSRWLNRATNKVNNWAGSCRKWGLR